MRIKGALFRRKAYDRKRESKKRSKLHVRMTMSYVAMAVGTTLVLEILFGVVMFIFLTTTSVPNLDDLKTIKQTAQLYAFATAFQTGGVSLNPHTTFEPDRPFSIALPTGYSNSIPYIGTSSPGYHNDTFALLIAPDGRILACSFPARYPASQPAARLLPERANVINNALKGVEGGAIDMNAPQGRVVYAAEPVWSRDKQVMGAIYVQKTAWVPGAAFIMGFLDLWLVSALIWLVITVPVGALFGIITTRGLVRRIRHLATSTALFANGNYTQRVPVRSRDEVGQLEQQFNSMADQLVESIAQRQTLAERNARLEERTRLSRDLHDSVKQQIFALAMQVSAALSLTEQKPEAVRERLIEAEALAYDVRQELTALIRELRPSALKDKEFSQALQEYVTSWSRQHTIAADLHVPPAFVLPAPVEEALLRVTQEALSNIARHSQATSVRVRLECGGDHVVLSLADNGQGFDPASVNGSGVGLHSMKERMEVLGGTLTVESHAGLGTRIAASAPVARTARADEENVAQRIKR
jgi:NarL family two-component system sensor histidine kinase LiaS